MNKGHRFWNWLLIALILGLLALAWFFWTESSRAQYFSAPPITLQNTQLTDANAMMTNYNRIISDGNTAFNNFATTIASVSGQAIPSKTILPFNLSACPSGWQPADGTAGSPDLRGYFIMITGGSGGPTMGTVTSTSVFLYHAHPTTGTEITGLSYTSQNFGSSGTIRAVGSYGMGGFGYMATGNIAGETRPQNVALLMCMKT